MIEFTTPSGLLESSSRHTAEVRIIEVITGINSTLRTKLPQRFAHLRANTYAITIDNRVCTGTTTRVYTAVLNSEEEM